MKNFMIIAGDSPDAGALMKWLKKIGYVHRTDKAAEVLDSLEKKTFDTVFADLDFVGQIFAPTELPRIFQKFRQLFSSLAIVLLVHPAKVREAVKAMKAGANDYLTYPFFEEEARLVLEELHKEEVVQSELDYLRKQFWQQDSRDLVRTKNPLMEQIYNQVRAVAPTKSTVLLTGETGTGKGVMAALIHQLSTRSRSRFISVHCGAIPDTLVESELFGHERGAFTGAVRKKLGKFEIAGGGTIFLDEIGTITPMVQVKLLQILQDGTFSRVGGEEALTADVRIIAATNSDLKAMCDAGHFRWDLYYRLNVFPLHLLPLRQRTTDIPQIAEVILARLNRNYGKNIKGFDSRVMDALRRYSWPGNIRELENVLERAYVLESGETLQPEVFPSDISVDHFRRDRLVNTAKSLSSVRQKYADEAELLYLREILAEKRGRIDKTAEAAGITPRQLHKLMQKHGLKKEFYKKKGER
jgi:DNA-binding NtrC family response regulator